MRVPDCLLRARPLRLLSVTLALRLLMVLCPARPVAAAIVTSPVELLAAGVCKGKAPKPPKRSKCREECERRNRSQDCADQDGNMMPCSCHCP
jgi:hypothetical protein